MKLKKIYSVCITLALAGAHAGNVLALDLLEAYEYARQNDATYSSALASYEAAKVNYPLARSANRPGVNAGLGVRYDDDEVNFDDGSQASSDYGQGELTVDLNQNLYDKSINYDIDEARVAVEIAELQLGIAEEALIVSTVSSYLNVLAALDNQNLAELERAANENQLELATQRLEVGLGTRTDQYDAKARYEAANAELIAAKNEVINAQQALEALMGRALAGDPKDVVQPLDNEKVIIDLVKGDAWVDEMLPNNRAHRIVLKQVDLQDIAVARSKDARFPSFGLYAGGRAADSGSTAVLQSRDSQTWWVGARATMPLYLGGSIKLRQEQAGYAQNAAKYDAEQSRRDTDRLIRAARRGAESLKRQAEALKEAVVAGKSALESKEEGFKAGITTNLIVLDAQRDLFLAGRNYFQASYDVVNALVILERATGQLDARDISRINTWLK